MLVDKGFVYVVYVFAMSLLSSRKSVPGGMSEKMDFALCVC